MAIVLEASSLARANHPLIDETILSTVIQWDEELTMQWNERVVRCDEWASSNTSTLLRNACFRATQGMIALEK